MKERIALALSGGIDSTMSAYFLQKQGYDVTCFTMDLFSDKEFGFEKGSGNKNNIIKSRELAKKLGLAHKVINLRSEFKKYVQEYLICEYFSGNTPNPCAVCNYHIKWGAFANIIEKLGFDKLASGHYADIKKIKGKYFIYKSKDESKDQTYFFWMLSQKQLSKMHFPLANMQKSKIKELALDLGLVSSISESRGVCFIKKDYKNLLDAQFCSKKGKVILNDKVIGHHKGIAYYTIGQRRGIDLPYSSALYVKKKNAKTNTLIVVENKEDLLKNKFYIKNCNFFSDDVCSLENLTVQTHYNTVAKKVKTISKIGNGFLVELWQSEVITAPGQSAVFYQKDVLVGGGVIC